MTITELAPASPRTAPLTVQAAHRHHAPTPTPVVNPKPPVRAVPNGTRARGFVLYVGIDEEKAELDGTTLPRLVDALRRLAAELAPSSETHAAVALAPADAGGRDVDVVRLALQDPSAIARRRATNTPRPAVEDERPGVVIDIGRKRLSVDSHVAPLTYTEFELLQYLVLREGQTVPRAQLIDGLWSDTDGDAPNERTIDVHVRRLRSKLGAYEDIVRTVRGSGYRFDRHADVSVRYASTPSPDVF